MQREGGGERNHINHHFYSEVKAEYKKQQQAQNKPPEKSKLYWLCVCCPLMPDTYPFDMLDLQLKRQDTERERKNKAARHSPINTTVYYSLNKRGKNRNACHGRGGSIEVLHQNLSNFLAVARFEFGFQFLNKEGSVFFEPKQSIDENSKVNCARTGVYYPIVFYEMSLISQTLHIENFNLKKKLRLYISSTKSNFHVNFYWSFAVQNVPVPIKMRIWEAFIN